MHLKKSFFTYSGKIEEQFHPGREFNRLDKNRLFDRSSALFEIVGSEPATGLSFKDPFVVLFDSSSMFSQKNEQTFTGFGDFFSFSSTKIFLFLIQSLGVVTLLLKKFLN